MIEVELRGRLDEENYLRLQKKFSEQGKLLDKHVREMYLLQGHQGYDRDPIRREVDIRLRNTSGSCEIMIKRKAFDNNIGREEISIPVGDSTLDNLKLFAKYLGIQTANKMTREKETYLYKGVEWSIVKAPKGIYYFEAEIRVDEPSDIPEAEQRINETALDLDVQLFNPDQTKEFLLMLDKTVNEVVDL